MVTFVQATFVLVTFVHIRNISAVTDTGKFMAMSKPVEDKVRVNSWQGPGED